MDYGSSDESQTEAVRIKRGYFINTQFLEETYMGPDVCVTDALWTNPANKGSDEKGDSKGDINGSIRSRDEKSVDTKEEWGVRIADLDTMPMVLTAEAKGDDQSNTFNTSKTGDIERSEGK